MKRNAGFAVLAALVAFLVHPSSPGAARPAPVAAPGTSFVLPQAGCVILPPGEPDPVAVQGVRATVSIRDLLATTTIEVTLSNRGERDGKASLLVPLPDGALVTGFAAGEEEVEARLMAADEARSLFRELLSAGRNTALAEFAGYRLARTGVFPVRAGRTAVARLVYQHALEIGAPDGYGRRVDYILPRSEIISAGTPWEIEVEIESREIIYGVYSPSHAVQVETIDYYRATARLARAAAREPGHFRLSYLRGSEGQGAGPFEATLMSCPDEEGEGGYFALALAAPPRAEEGAADISREVTLVIDRSGSMGRVKMDQVRDAAALVLRGLNHGEAFNIIDFSRDVRAFSDNPVIKDADTEREALAYIEALRASGTTALHGALMRALEQEATPGMLPIVILLTDGIANVGVTREPEIRADAINRNPAGRRVFTFGVGYDVNAPLLDAIAAATRATSAYVAPEEKVEESVALLFTRLTGPVLAAPSLRVSVTGARGGNAGTTGDILPAVMPDLFANSTFIVTGRYRNGRRLRAELTGRTGEGEKTFVFDFALEGTAERNPFVPRLWAGRKIAALLDEIRQVVPEGTRVPVRRPVRPDPVPGPDPGPIVPRPPRPIPIPGPIPEPAPQARRPVPLPEPVMPPLPDDIDPRVRELIDQVIELSLRYGILTEYTAFLVADRTDYSDREVLFKAAAAPAMDMQAERSGMNAVSRARELGEQSRALNVQGRFASSAAGAGRAENLQLPGNLVFVRQEDRWVETRLVSAGERKPDEEIERGTGAWFELLEKLAARNSQAALALEGEIVLELDGRMILVRN